MDIQLKDAQLEQHINTIQELTTELVEKEDKVRQREEELQRKESQLQEKSEELQQRNIVITSLQREVEMLKVCSCSVSATCL